MTMTLSADTTSTAGLLLLSITAIELGGTFLLRIARGRHEVTELQRTFFRAGHAHAGVLVILGLVVRLCLQHPAVPAWSSVLADFVLYAAVLMSAGFFLSVIGRDPQRPNRWIALLWLGAASLTVGLAGA